MKRVVKTPTAHAAADARYDDPSFSAAVISWQQRHGRHSLPWQNTRDAYRIWLSEIMLQQTQVSAVIPYYLRFLERFPGVESLAAAPAEAVMALWSGLGYYSRARHLHRCAQEVMVRHGGRFPDDPELLAQLPGIGRSTAAAIAAFAYGTRAAILDGNVKRVFCRVFGISGFPGEREVENALWQRASALLPETGIEAYTQGLMDLGATLCTRGKPDCNACPLAERCVALSSGRVGELPQPKPRKALPERSIAMVVVTDGRRVLLEQRPQSGIWGGLLSLPELAPDAADGQQLRALAAPYGNPVESGALHAFTHTFTHFRLHVSPHRVQVVPHADVAAEAGLAWYPVGQLAEAPLPAPVKKLLLAMF